MNHVASFGLQPNMIIYITTFYRMEAAPASVLISFWEGLGLLLLEQLQVSIRECLFYGSQVRPLPCGQYHDGCNGVTAVQLAVFLFSLGLFSIGAGFVRPCSIAFGQHERQLVGVSMALAIITFKLQTTIITDIGWSRILARHNILVSWFTI